MHQRNAEQRNSKRKTNLILVSYFFSRSSLKPRANPSQSVRPENLKCAICIQNEKRGKQKNTSNINRKSLVTLRTKSIHQLQTSTPQRPLLESRQQIFTVMKNFTKIILGNRIELF